MTQYTLFRPRRISATIIEYTMWYEYMWVMFR